MFKLITSAAAVVVAGIALFLTSCGSSTIAERKPVDQLDSVKVDTGIVRELKDVYRIYRVNDKIDNIRDEFGLYYENDSIAATNVIARSFNLIDSLKNTAFYDDSLKTFNTYHLIGFELVNKAILAKGLSSDSFVNEFERYKKAKGYYFDYIDNKYSTNHFLKISEEEYNKQIDKQQFIKSPEYAHYLSMAKSDLKGSIELLKKIVSNTKSFQEKSIYQMELANSIINNFNKLDSGEVENAIKIYEDILKNKEYSLYKFEAWRRWRTTSQAFIYGTMKDANIPNTSYDKLRMECASQILNHYVNHPKDEMALNQFLDFASHNIIYRNGDFEKSNQFVEDFSDLFTIGQNYE